MSGDGNGMGIRNREKFRLQMRKNGLPGALDGALEMNGLDAQHWKQAAA